MSEKTIPVTMPEWVWGRLATIASFRKVDVADVVALALRRELDLDQDQAGQLAAELSVARRAGLRVPRRGR